MFILQHLHLGSLFPLIRAWAVRHLPRRSRNNSLITFFRWGPYIWPAILLWALDVFLRFVRVVLSNVNNTTSIEVLSPHFLRLSVDKPRFFHWRAGQSVYLTLPGISFWQAHPFTIAYEDESKLVFFVRVRKGFSKRLLMNAEQGKMRVWMDGPYSSPPLIRGCDSVVFVAGKHLIRSVLY